MRMASIEKALVIDDHQPTSEFIAEILRACEIETYNTSDSKLAEARLRRERFDVVFVDAKMPAPDGLEFDSQDSLIRTEQTRHHRDDHRRAGSTFHEAASSKPA